MLLVVDANVLFAALIRAGATSGLLFDDRLRLFAPEHALAEYRDHESGVLLRKTHRSRDEFLALAEALGRRIGVVPASELRDFLEEARSVSPDPDDVPYFAAALRLRAPLWSNDGALKAQTRIRVLTTRELLAELAP